MINDNSKNLQSHFTFEYFEMRGRVGKFSRRSDM